MAQFILPIDHVFDPTEQTDPFISEFLQNQGLGYFSCHRFYQDGSFISLSTQPKFVIDWFIDNPVITPIPKEATYQQTYTFLWHEAVPLNFLNLAREKYSLYQGICLIFRYLDYYDRVSFAMPEEKPMACSYYLSSLSLLRWCYREFLKKYNRPIRELEKRKITLPTEKQDKNLSSILLQNQKGKIEFESANGHTYVTQKELFCINLVRNGYSYKHIADIFEVSNRTIDTYLTRAKERTGYRNLDEILYHVR